MSDVFWKVNKPDHDGVVWTDLRDYNIKGKRNWVITYRRYHGCWHVMWSNNKYNDQLLHDTVPEEQLRNDLKLAYLLTRGET